MNPAEQWAGALCAEIGGDLWFPDKGERDIAQAAMAICNDCPIRLKCLDYALDAERTGFNLDGIWGGLPPRKRIKLRDRKSHGPGRLTKPCGTAAAYQRHRRRGEQPCEACKRAHNADRAARKQAIA